MSVLHILTVWQVIPWSNTFPYKEYSTVSTTCIIFIKEIAEWILDITLHKIKLYPPHLTERSGQPLLVLHGVGWGGGGLPGLELDVFLRPQRLQIKTGSDLVDVLSRIRDSTRLLWLLGLHTAGVVGWLRRLGRGIHEARIIKFRTWSEWRRSFNWTWAVSGRILHSPPFDFLLDKPKLLSVSHPLPSFLCLLLKQLLVTLQVWKHSLMFLSTKLQEDGVGRHDPTGTSCCPEPTQGGIEPHKCHLRWRIFSEKCVHA